MRTSNGRRTGSGVAAAAPGPFCVSGRRPFPGFLSGRPICEHWGVLNEPADNSPIRSDADLLREYARTRSEDAFARLVARHSRALHRLAFHHTGDAAAAEDVVQATFIVLSRRPLPALRSARRRRSALPWLAKVCRYAAANWNRARARRTRRERFAAVRDVAGKSEVAEELIEAVRSALACLSREERRVIELRHLSQMSWSDVSRHVGGTPEAARKLGGRAILRLPGGARTARRDGDVGRRLGRAGRARRDDPTRDGGRRASVGG